MATQKNNVSKLQAIIPGFERVVVAVKPDGVKRALVGEVVRRMEAIGLKLVASKMETPTEATAKKNYPNVETPAGHEWMVNLGRKTLKTYEENKRDVKKELGTNDPEILGQKVYNKLIEYLMSGPMVIMVWEGHQAVGQARAVAGDTTPSRAIPGTIRGDLSFDSQILGNIQGRIVIRNVCHVSGTPEEALQEIANWFGEDAKFSDKYIRTDHLAMFGKI